MSLRAIEVPDRHLPPVARGAPDLRWIAIDDLVIDDRYQRPLLKSDWAHIRKIAAEFRWDRFTPCLVAPVGGGRFAVIDGQHRSHGAAMAGEVDVPCMVVPLDMAGQASAFSWVNGNVTAITTFHVYKAALAAGEGWALGARDAVAAGGGRLMEFNRSAKEKKPGEIFAIKLVRGHVEAGRAAVITDGIGAIMGSAQAGDVRLYSDAVLRPWFAVLADRPGLTRAHLAGFLAKTDLWKVQQAVWRQKQDGEFSHLSQFELMRRGLDLLLKAHFAKGVSG